MGNPEKNNNKITVGTDRTILDPTVDIDQYKLNQEMINKLARVLAEKCPPNSDMYHWITGWDALGKAPRRHIINRIYILVLSELPEVKKNNITYNTVDIFTAYKKAITDVTHVINKE